jgi:serine/threonine-protein kinase RIM15
MAEDGDNTSLRPPAVLALQDAARLGAMRGQMERTTSADIREDGKELREAAEQSLNVILDIKLDGTVRWTSETWQDVIGTPVESVKGKEIAEVLVENKTAFENAIHELQEDDAKSKNIRFSVLMGPLSALNPEHKNPIHVSSEHDATTVHVLELEGQGILVYDRTTGQASHVRPHRNRSDCSLTSIDYVDDPAFHAKRSHDRSPRSSCRLFR